MNSLIKKTLTAGLAALTVGAVFMSATPSQARPIWIVPHHSGWSGGHWHSGWRGGHWRGNQGWVGPAVFGGLAGAIIGAAAAPYAYGDPCWQYRAVYDGYGRFIGRHYVNVCN